MSVHITPPPPLNPITERSPTSTGDLHITYVTVNMRRTWMLLCDALWLWVLKRCRKRRRKKVRVVETFCLLVRQRAGAPPAVEEHCPASSRTGYAQLNHFGRWNLFIRRRGEQLNPFTREKAGPPHHSVIMKKVFPLPMLVSATRKRMRSQGGYGRILKSIYIIGGPLIQLRRLPCDAEMRKVKSVATHLIWNMKKGKWIHVSHATKYETLEVYPFFFFRNRPIPERFRSHS